MTQSISPKELQDARDALVIDVRRKEVYDASHEAIPGSEWRDPALAEQWMGELPADREVVIYCVRGGAVSNSVCGGLIEKGLKARYIEGGIEGWKAAGGKVAAKSGG